MTRSWTRQTLLVALAVGLFGLAPRLAEADPKRAAELISVAKRAQRLGKYRFAIHAFK